jgi:general secretion pathway protein N
MKPVPAAARPGTRRGNGLFLLAAALGLSAGALAFAPARALALLVREVSDGQVRLLNARGTIWQGRAEWVLTGGAGSRSSSALPQGLGWRLAPAWSDGPALRLQLSVPCCAPQGMDLLLAWRAGAARLELGRQHSAWPASWLAGLGSPWNTIQLQGSLELQTEGSGIEWARGRARLTGPFELRALDLGSSLSTLKPLGSYRLRFEPDAGGSPQVRLDTLRGELRLSGEGRWTSGRLRFRGEGEAATGSERALSNLLNILGRRDGARVHISLG